MQGALGASPLALAMGRSIGSPTAGHLVGGARLPDAPYLRVVPVYAQGEVRWGLGSLIGMIDRAAQKVRKQYPDAILNVGHISRHGGGEVDRHVSHESGRDADIGFYVRNAQGKPVYAEHFVPFRGDGTAPTWPGAIFDDARNWALVRSLITDPQAHVTHIFVATPLRARLLAFAAKSGASPELRERAALTIMQPHGALAHDDHFHVRISCPAWQRECVEVAVRKRPALVAKVPVPKGRVRAQPQPTDSSAAKRASSSAPRTASGSAGIGLPGLFGAHGSAAPMKANSAADAKSPTESAPADVAPPAILSIPQKGAPEPDTDPVDDVDGPM